MQQRPPQTLDETLRSTQIIAGALIAGVVMFGVVATFVGAGADPGEPLVGYIAILFAVSGLVMRSVFPGTITARKRNEIRARVVSGEIDESHEMTAALYPLYQTKTIIEYALIEGPAFFVLIAFIVTSRTWVLAVAAALLAVMVLTFPTRARLEGWIRNQLQLMELDRS